MRIAVLLCFVFLCFHPMSAQEIWSDDYDIAIERSKKERKPLLIVFTGSDWCRSCMKLEKELLSSAEFKAFADSALVLYNADFPRNKKVIKEERLELNTELANRFNPKGSFPFLVIVNPAGEIIWTSKYHPAGPAYFLPEIEKAIK